MEKLNTLVDDSDPDVRNICLLLSNTASGIDAFHMLLAGFDGADQCLSN